MILFSHPAVNSYTRNMACALQEAGLLHSMVTTLGWSETAIPQWFPAGLKGQLKRRAVPAEIGPKLRAHPVREAMRLASSAVGIRWGGRHETGALSVDAVYRSLDLFASRQLNLGHSANLRAVYAGEDGALATFRVAQNLGLSCFYDLPIGYWREAQRVYQEERERAPEFAPTLTGLEDSDDKLARKEEEMRMADAIFACSPFVKNSLVSHGVEPSRIEVVPYGAPDPGLPPRLWTREDYQRPLRVLFVGSLGQRKGIGYLLQAIGLLGRKDVELVLLGRFSGESAPVLRYRDRFRLEPPRPHSAVLQLMRDCDVFVLPSLFEGLAMVIPEAMSCGLPVIITPSTGAAFLVKNGEEGFIVSERSSHELAEKIAWFADNRLELPRMGRAASKTATEHSWTAYRSHFKRVVRSRCQGFEPSDPLSRLVSSS